MLGIICQKAMIIMLLASFVLCFLYWFSGSVLIAIGQAEDIAAQGQILARGLIPQLFAFALNCPMQRFLQARYVSSGNGGLEIWYSQGLVLISGLLPNAEVSLDSISVCMNYLNWDMMLMLGISYAASIRVGNELRAQRPRTAKFSVVVVTTTCFIISLILSIAVLVLKRPLSLAFTSSDEVIEAVQTMTPLLALSVLLNGTQPILSGVAIGCGWQALVAYVNLATYYLIGLPIGCFLGFKTELDEAGIWWGLINGVGLQTAILIVLTARTNWDKEVDKAAAGIKRSNDEATFENGAAA
ncbi:protein DETOXIFICATION 41-like [Amborella trichopoda]|uniref:protein DETOXIFICATION 41-like n=1 Tax=Amborella trichopoda TaxID=13333 RepID=UPI0005D3CC3B|nr:protein DETOXIFICATION 41-like [Amborella trichopoda]|eukprot:XP_011620816.1 protein DETOXIFICATION 41-like [Amborella trichopoda]